MLNYQDFQVIQSYSPYDFRLLDPYKKETTSVLYKSLEDNKLVRVVSTQSLEYLQLIHILEEFDIIDGPLGYLKKGVDFYIFMDLRDEITLLETVKQRKIGLKKPYFSEHQTFQLIKVVVSFLDVLKERGMEFNLHVLTPKDFVIIAINKTNKIKFRFPLQEPIFDQKGIAYEYLKEQAEFWAPELRDIPYYDQSKSEKAAIYSLGLLILFSIFGETSNRMLKPEHSPNDIEFQNQFKFKRKQIKVYYNSKTVPKILKMLLEKRERVRDGIKTLKAKLLSPVFSSVGQSDSLQIEKEEIVDDVLIEHKTTRSFDYGDSIVPLERKDTIQFQVMMKTGSINTMNNSGMHVSNNETAKESKMTINCLSGLDAEIANSAQVQNSNADLLPFDGKFQNRMLQTILSSPIQPQAKSPVWGQTHHKNHLFYSQNVLILNQTRGQRTKTLKKQKKIEPRFSGRVQQFQKFKLVSYLLFGIVVLLIGLCLLYLSLFSEQ